MLNAAFLVVGLLIGVVSGLLGIGGGVLLVPAIMLLLTGHDQIRAQGIALAVLVLPVVLPSVWQYYPRFKEGDVLAALLIAAGFAIGGYVGAHLVSYVPLEVLRLMLGLVLIYVGTRFLLISDNEFAHAFFGLVAMAFALAAYYFLRALGRKHMPKPVLGEMIRTMPATNASDLDYYI